MINMLTMATITHSTQNRKLAIRVGNSFRILNGIIKSSTKRNTNQVTQPQNDLPISFSLLFVEFKLNPTRKAWFIHETIHQYDKYPKGLNRSRIIK